MTDESVTPNKTDVGWFEDSEQLGEYLRDSRLADTRMVSSFADAQEIIGYFEERTDDQAWPSLDRAEVAARLREIFAAPDPNGEPTGYRSIDQGALNQCGPAAFLVMAIGRDPASVAKYATDLFEVGSGSVGDFLIEASSDLLNADYAEMATKGAIPPQADWMMLSAVRNSTEAFWQPEWVGNPDDELSGMTRPEELADWMRQTNIWSSVDDRGRWATNPGIPDAADHSVAEGTDTAVLIHANLLKESSIEEDASGPQEHNWTALQYFPNHWVILLSEVVPQIDDGSIKFTVWTWGRRLTVTAPQQVFIDNYFGTVSGRL